MTKDQKKKVLEVRLNNVKSSYILRNPLSIYEVKKETIAKYVDSLKKQGKFDLEAQKKAFQDTYDAIYHLLSDEALMYLSELLPDLSKYITSSIESQIYLNK